LWSNLKNHNNKFINFISHKPKGKADKIILSFLYLISRGYELIIFIRDLCYKKGIKRSFKLPCKVISIGSITVGGAGKTPVTAYISEKLFNRGFAVAILSRGYKGSKERKMGVVSLGEKPLLSYKESGDEPAMLASMLKGIPVIVGKNRFSAGKWAIRNLGTKIIILDDGFSHLRLKRDINILLIDANKGLNHHLLPRGILREPLSALKRADMVMLTKIKQENSYEEVESMVREFLPNLSLFKSFYHVKGLKNLNSGEVIRDKNLLKDKKVLAFSGIADDDYFVYLIKRCGAKEAEVMKFPDHHYYTYKDIVKIKEKSRFFDMVITTSKDEVKLREFDFNGLDLYTLLIDVSVIEEEKFISKLINEVKKNERDYKNF